MAIAGLALAAPGVVSAFCEYGNWIRQRVHTFNNAKDVWKDLGKFGHVLSEGKLKLDIELAKNAYVADGFDPVLKKNLEAQIERLGVEVLAAKHLLASQNTDSIFGKGKFAISGESRAKKINKNLRSWQKDFSDLIFLVLTAKLELPDELLLSEKRFQHDEGQGYIPVPYTTNLFVVDGEYKEKERDEECRQVTVLIERRSKPDAVPARVIREIASYLSYRLAEGITNRGVLHCLGFRMEPMPELIFEIPRGMHNPQTLQTLITADIGKEYGGDHPLDFRFRLARQLSEAVLSVHIAKLVHKNIRAETIIILQPEGDEQDDGGRPVAGFGQPYLTNWSLLREASTLTQKRGTTEWTENIYRHPERQGLQIQTKYNLGHDIYSLGVCLLEIGLWDTFVLTRTASGDPQVSSLFKQAAKVDSVLKPDVALNQVLKNPLKVKEVMQTLAKQKLPSRMGIGYTRLVEACLNNLEGGFGESVDFRQLNSAEAGLAFNDLILSSFTNLSF
jgi:hypothetical protein